MDRKLRDYILFLEEQTKEPLPPDGRQRLKEDLLVQISFFQHERLIHLIVTAAFALFTLLTFFAVLAIEQLALWALLLLFAVLLIPYIAHYYKLENGVQRLYSFYDKVSGTAHPKKQIK